MTKLTDLDSIIPDSDIIAKVRKVYDKHCSAKTVEIVDIADPEDFFLLTFFMNDQKKSGDIENFIRKSFSMSVVPSSNDSGDSSKDGLFYEFKTSTTNPNQTLNIRQIKMWKKVDWYYCAYIDELDLSNSKCFKLSKRQMEEEVKRIGGSTHGVKGVKKYSKFSEYSITLPVGNLNNPNTQRWVDLYWHQEFYDKLNPKGLQ